MASPSHRTSASVSQTNLLPPSGSGSPINRQRRMTTPNLLPPSPLNLPEPAVYGQRRPPSPLRNSFAAGDESESGSEESENGHQWGERPVSPSASVTQFAANIAQKMGTLMSNMSQSPPNHLPTDEELEAEAEREREKSRQEAERILIREAEAKRLEQRVLAMLETDRSPGSLPPPPPLGQVTPGTPPSPSNSQKESWWTIAKSKLTPTKEKEALTPAQQVIQESKQREKELEKEKREIEKEKKEIEKEMKKHEKQTKKHGYSKSAQWPSSPEDKYQDPAFLKLHQEVPHPPRRPSPVSPTPNRIPVPSMPPSLAPSPKRGISESGSASPSRGSTPLYAVFNHQGVLDIPATLITIAQRFEKLEKWTVGHTRALEERMDDVERWLVDKENERDANGQRLVETQRTGDLAPADAFNEIREELAEVQGRIGELGREMAKMVTAPGNLSSGPSRSPAGLGRAPSTNSAIAVRSISANLAHTTRVSTPPRKEPSTSPSTSPPVGAASRTRLPYPTGDYATPPDSVFLTQGPFSPPHSPPQSASKGTRTSISGLPSQSQEAPSSTSGLPSRAMSPPQRQDSVSPTPRKRYTVALGEPIMKTEERSRERSESGGELSSAFFSSPKSMKSLSTHDTDDDDSYYDVSANEETVGKAAARYAGLTIPPVNKVDSKTQDRRNSISPTPAPKQAQRRTRPQSMYTVQQFAASTPSTPSRSRSTDKFGLSSTDSRFVDPLVIRKQTKEALASTAPRPPKVLPGRPKVPVGQLVAFFDQEKT